MGANACKDGKGADDSWELKPANPDARRQIVNEHDPHRVTQQYEDYINNKYNREDQRRVFNPNNEDQIMRAFKQVQQNQKLEIDERLNTQHNGITANSGVGQTSTPRAQNYTGGRLSNDGSAQRPEANSADKRYLLKQFFKYLNDVRQNPGRYVERINTLYVKHSEDLGGYPVDRNTSVRYNEGWEMFTQAQQFLQSTTPLPPFDFEAGLTAAAFSQAADCAKVKSVGHVGSDGTQVYDRMLKFGDFREASDFSAENCFKSIDCNPEMWVLDMILNDGVLSRRDRANIFDPNFKKVGVAFVQGLDRMWYTCITFAGKSYASKQLPNDIMQAIHLA